VDLDDDACYRAVLTRDRRFDGRLFVAVTTTGIYCRPVCPARTPRRENVRFYPSAAAAQDAGFRPCLRCRPESSPELRSWRGTSNTVSRALGLIEGGALGEGDVESLADRLGVGERQLRRLFEQHLGASPLAVAHTRRVLLAKQLIHDTRLPMSEVALAAGFGSVRRFNETFRSLYGRAPGSLRRADSPDATAVAAGDVTLRLAYRPPFDWDAMLAFLALRAIPGVEAVSGRAYARSIALAGHHGIISVEPGEGASAKATIRFPRVDALPAIIARIRRVFDLSADPVAIGAHLAEDPLLAPLVVSRPGLRVPGAWDGFELGARAILGQAITVSAARRLAGALAEACGEPLKDARANAAGLTRVFPDPVRVARSDLSTLAMPHARIGALRSLARALLDDPSLLDASPSLEPDAFPAGDSGLVRALATRLGHRPTPAELLSRAERWRPWRAYAAAHLWASLAADGFNHSTPEIPECPPRRRIA